MREYVMTDVDGREIRRVVARDRKHAMRLCRIVDETRVGYYPSSIYDVVPASKFTRLSDADLHALNDDSREMGPAVPMA
jgi:hypothetical protein